MNWDKAFQSPFKIRRLLLLHALQVNQRWGTATPITIRDKEFGAVRLRGYGIYSYRISRSRAFSTRRSAARATSTTSRISKASFATPSSAA